MDTFNKVAQMLADHKGIDVNTITMDSTFAELQGHGKFVTVVEEAYRRWMPRFQ